MTTLNEEVKSELVAMKSVGMKVPTKLLDSVDKMDLSEYDNMSTSEIADLLIELS